MKALIKSSWGIQDPGPWFSRGKRIHRARKFRGRGCLPFPGTASEATSNPLESSEAVAAARESPAASGRVGHGADEPGGRAVRCCRFD